MREGRYVESAAGTSVHSTYLVVYLMHVATYMQYMFIPSEFAKVHAYVIFVGWFCIPWVALSEDPMVG